MITAHYDLYSLYNTTEQCARSKDTSALSEKVSGGG